MLAHVEHMNLYADVRLGNKAKQRQGPLVDKLVNCICASMKVRRRPVEKINQGLEKRPAIPLYLTGDMLFWTHLLRGRQMKTFS